MKITVSASNFEGHQRQVVENIAKKKLLRLERLLTNWRQSDLHLRVHGEQTDRLGTFQISLNLSVPHRNLVSRAEQSDLASAVNEAFIDLERETKRYKARHRRSYLSHRRGEMRDAIQQAGLPAPTEPIHHQHSLKEFSNRLESLMPALYNYALREIQILDIANELPELPEPTELINQTIVKAYDSFSMRPDDDHLLGWLYQLMHNIVEQTPTQSSSDAHIEDKVASELPAFAVSTEGTEQLDFWQPDEQLLLEDLLPDISLPDPAHEMDDTELNKIIQGELANIPARQRRVFIMHMLEGFETFEIAMVQGRNEQEVQQDLEVARMALEKALRQRWFQESDFKE